MNVLEESGITHFLTASALSRGRICFVREGKQSNPTRKERNNSETKQSMLDARVCGVQGVSLGTPFHFVHSSIFLGFSNIFDQRWFV